MGTQKLPQIHEVNNIPVFDITFASSQEIIHRAQQIVPSDSPQKKCGLLSEVDHFLTSRKRYAVPNSPRIRIRQEYLRDALVLLQTPYLISLNPIDLVPLQYYHLENMLQEDEICVSEHTARRDVNMRYLLGGFGVLPLSWLVPGTYHSSHTGTASVAWIDAQGDLPKTDTLLAQRLSDDLQIRVPRETAKKYRRRLYAARELPMGMLHPIKKYELFL